MSDVKPKPIRGNATRSRRRPEVRRFGFGFRLAALVGSACLILGLVAWLWHVGWPQRQVEHAVNFALYLTQKADFTVRDIEVDGRRYTERGELFAALGTSDGAPILAFNPVDALARVQQLPWVASATIERRLPDSVVVRLVERQPIARWQHDNKTVVIDRDGNPLPRAKPELFAKLPLLVGADAPQHAEEFLDTLGEFPALAANMKAAVRVGDRRWDLYLPPNLVVKLPENDMKAALARLVGLINDEKVLERNLVAIDLRLPDRFTMEPAAGQVVQAKPQLTKERNK